MRTRTWGTSVGLIAAVFALRPIGPSELLSQALRVPARVVGSLGLPAHGVAAARAPSSTGSDEASLALEAELSLRLERAVLRSAWPESVALGRRIVAVPGETLGRAETSRDRLTLRVSDTRDLEIGQPVVAGDAYVGRIDRIPYEERRLDRPGLLERMLRRVGLSEPPRPSPRDIVEVALITGPNERVGGLVEEDANGFACRLVAGGLVPRDDRIWLAVHNPESRATRSGTVRVHEPLGLLDGFDSLAEGFLIGELVTESRTRIAGAGGTAAGTGRGAVDPFARHVRGIRPAVDFGSGLNQVLVLTRPRVPRAARSVDDIDPVPVATDGGWRDAHWLVQGDTSPWRSTARLDRGRRAGVAVGAAVVDGVRLVGRVSSVDPFCASVVLVDDPGTELTLLAQSVLQPDAAPLVVGRVVTLGRAATGELLVEWRPESSSARAAWLAARSAADEDAAERGTVPVRLWTGSGMKRVPRGLLIGRTEMPLRIEGSDHDDGTPATGESGAVLAAETGGTGPGHAPTPEAEARDTAIVLRLSATGRAAGTPRVRVATGRPAAGAVGADVIPAAEGTR